MRQVGLLESELLARRFSNYLSLQQIDNTIDAAFDPATEKASYAIWVHNEDRLTEASDLFQTFQANPSAPQFEGPCVEAASVAALHEAETESAAPPPRPRLTLFWILVCVMAFFLNTMQEIPMMRAGFQEHGFLMTPIRFKLLYDIPPAFDRLESASDSAQAEEELVQAEHSLYWRGLYYGIVAKVVGQPVDMGADTLFYKIRQGQIWRLFSPSILHGGLLHIAFNMLWLWALGKEIDVRIGTFRSLLLTLSAGIVSNTIQYLMSGPFFLGYSGIITALAGFIWSRQTLAPWEGYPLQRSMLLFLALFVLGMAALQIGSFLFLVFTHKMFMPNMANSAHLSGAIWGIFLGRLRFFSARGMKP